VSLALIAEQMHGDMMAFENVAVEVVESYFVESAAADNVHLSVNLRQLSRALSSASASNAVVVTLMKLAKRDGAACLLVCLEGAQVSSIEHLIPVKLHRASEIERYKPPNHARPRLVFELPVLSTLKTLVDRLKFMGEKKKRRVVDVKFEAAGVLGLRAVSDSAVVKAFFTNLKLAPASSQAADVKVAIVVAVDARNLNKR